jgi:hypothetical protein
MALDPVSAITGLADTVIKRLWPDKTEQERAQMAAALTVIQGQLDANKAEAGSSSVFVSGWRPFIGWVCGSACAWNWIGLPCAKFGLALAGVTVSLSPADLGEMWPLLLGMLGLGGLRTVEKINGVAAS